MHPAMRAKLNAGIAGRQLSRGSRLMAALVVVIAVAALTAAGFRGFAPLFALEGALADRIATVARPLQPVQYPGISVIAVNEATLAKLPYRSPLDRGFLAAVLDAIGKAGVKAVALDILFDQPTEDDKDLQLAQAIKDFPAPVVVAWGDERAGLTDKQREWLQIFIDFSGAQPGAAGLLFDPDGVVRRHSPTDPVAGIPSLPVALTGVQTDGPETIAWLAGTEDGKDAFQVLPAHSIVLMAKRPAILKRWLEGRIVLIGADLPQQDRHRSRLSADPSQPEFMPGVLIHAHVAAQLEDGRHIAQPGLIGFVLLVIGAAALAAVIAISGRAFWLQLLAGTVLLAAWGALVIWLAQSQQILMPVAPVLAAYLLSYALMAGMEALRQRREKAFIRDAFGHYVAPVLVKELSRNPGLLKLGGERRELSFIFTDIAGFTSMSEKLPPADLNALLNAYLDGMSDIVLAHGGTLDKFIGDAVVAIFGAPVAQPDHAKRALDCAMALDRFAEDFRAEHLDKGLGVTRIGVHRGEATVGNFGGEQRFDYTAMGDAMNTAARLEGANKSFGTRVAVSGDLLESLPDSDDRPQMQKVGDVILKGRTATLGIFTPVPDEPEALLMRYADALDMLDADPGQAEGLFENLAADWPDNPLVRMHRERLAAGETGSTFELKEK